MAALLSVSGIPKTVSIKNTKTMAHVKIKHGKNLKKNKKKLKLKKCVGGGCNLHCFLCLISNTLPHLEPSSLQPPSVLHHPHLLKTTCYNHLLLHLLLIIIIIIIISRKENRCRNRLRTPLSRGLRSQTGLQPTAAYIVASTLITLTQ